MQIVVSFRHANPLFKIHSPLPYWTCFGFTQAANWPTWFRNKNIKMPSQWKSHPCSDNIENPHRQTNIEEKFVVLHCHQNDHQNHFGGYNIVSCVSKQDSHLSPDWFVCLFIIIIISSSSTPSSLSWSPSQNAIFHWDGREFGSSKGSGPTLQ